MTKQENKPRRRELLLLGKRLRSWRKAKGWSQEKLAWAAGIDYSYFNEIENGKINPGIMTLFTLAQVLDVSPAVFFLPVAQAQKLEKSTEVQGEKAEQSLSSGLHEPTLIDHHCNLIDAYIQTKHLELAQTWLLALKALFPKHSRLIQMWNHYQTLKNQPNLAVFPGKVANPKEPYN